MVGDGSCSSNEVVGVVAVIQSQVVAVVVIGGSSGSGW